MATETADSTLTYLREQYSIEEYRFLMTRYPSLFVAHYFDFEIDPYQEQILDHVRSNRRSLILLPAGHGKDVALDTPLPTPAGWTTMGEVQAGDELLDADGFPCRVIAKSPVFTDHKCYAVNVNKEDTIIAGEGHQWAATLDSRCGERIYTTADLARPRRHRASIRIAFPLDLPDADLPIPPYTLGYWLGNGTACGSEITVQPCDAPHVADRIEEEGYETKYREERIRLSVYELRGDLRHAGLLNNKHIPSVYLRASEEQRLALLQGLIDSDGYVAPEGQVEFCSKSQALADGVVELVRTLGAKAMICAGEATLNGQSYGTKYRPNFYLENAASLPRKAALCRDADKYTKHYVDAVETGTVPTQCVQVDSPDGLFLAGRSMVPTHNSSLLSFANIILEICANPNIRIILIMKTFEDAKAYCDLIRHELVDNTKLVEDFGPFVSDKWTSEAFNVAGRQISDPHYTLEVFGTGGKVLGHRCVTPESLVVTSNGCVPVSTLKSGDFVQTHMGRYQRIVATATRETKEPVYSFNVVGLRTTSRLTGDHPILAWKNNRLGWVPARDIEEGDHFAIPTPRTNGSHRVFTKEDLQSGFQKLRKRDDFWRLYGYYLAEGNTTGTAKKPGHGVSFAFRTGEPWIADVCAITDEVLGVQPHLHERPETNCTSVVVRHQVFRKLAEMCGRYAHTKMVPYWAKRASVRHQQQLAIGYFRGDGCSYTANGSKPVSITTASFDLARDFQEMFSAWGYAANVHKLRDAGEGEIRGRKINQREAWSLTSCDGALVSILTGDPIKISLKHSKPQGFFIPGYRMCPVRSIAVEDYEGPVYDIEVKEDHSFCMPDLTAKNCDLCVADDVVTDESSATQEQRDKQERWFRMQVQRAPQSKWPVAGNPKWEQLSQCIKVPEGIHWPRDINYNRIIVAGTTFHPDDLYHRLGGGPPWDGSNPKADRTYKTLYFDCWTDKEETQPLWPAQWTKESLEAERDSLKIINFNKRMRNIAYDESEMTFQEAWILGGTWHEQEFPGCIDENLSFGDTEGLERTALGFDPASGKKTKYAAWPAYTLLGREAKDEDKPARFRVVDMFKNQTSVLDDHVATLLFGNPQGAGMVRDGFYSTYHQDVTVIEANSWAAWITEHPKIVEARRQGIDIRASWTQRNKQDPQIGIPMIQQIVMDGLLRIPYATPSDKVKARQLIDEMILYPKAFSDLLMALWLAWLFLREDKNRFRVHAPANSRAPKVLNPYFQRGS